MIQFHGYLRGALSALAENNAAGHDASASRMLFRLLFTFASGHILTNGENAVELENIRKDCRFIVTALLAGTIEI
ncbi:hypothetical protein FACS1894208_01650 [Clostridia bacterium]|nr:hypothetical protein FACS1894208_01650 [Clostridia bacterium]